MDPAPLPAGVNVFAIEQIQIDFLDRLIKEELTVGQMKAIIRATEAQVDNLIISPQSRSS